MIINRYIFISLKWLFLSILLALLDIGTKYWIKIHFLIGDVQYIFPGVNLCYINNSGIAFGLLSHISLFYRKILTGIIIFIIIIFIVSLYRSVKNHIIYNSVSYSLIIGGSIGNLYDRIYYGAVIDFIDCYIKNWHWPAFNIADIEICFGFILLLISCIMSYDIYTKTNIK